MSYPEGIVTTKIGNFRIVAQGRKTLYVDGNYETRDSENGVRSINFVTVRGCNYRATMHLKDYGNGYEPAKNEHGSDWDSYYLSRDGQYGRNAGVSDSARKVLVAAMLAAALEWVKANPEAPIYAGIHEEEQASESFMSEVATLEKKILDLNAKAAQSRERRLAYWSSLPEDTRTDSDDF